MRIAGIDPGLHGACAVVYDNATRFNAFPFLSVKAKGRGNEMLWAMFPARLETLLFEVDHVFIERVGVFPGEGASSGFKFGTCAGGVRGMITMLRLPVTMITPASWKTSMHLGSNKAGAIARACELFPKDIEILTPKRGERTKKSIEGVAEAALIAYCGYQIMRKAP